MYMITLQIYKRMQQQVIDIDKYDTEKIHQLTVLTYPTCSSHPGDSCIVCMETVVRKIPLPYFTAFHTPTFISSKQTYSKEKGCHFNT